MTRYVQTVCLAQVTAASEQQPYVRLAWDGSRDRQGHVAGVGGPARGRRDGDMDQLSIKTLTGQGQGPAGMPAGWSVGLEGPCSVPWVSPPSLSQRVKVCAGAPWGPCGAWRLSESSVESLLASRHTSFKL